MKFMHLSDLHLGKTVHEFSMLEDQEYILKILLQICDEQALQAVLIAGDVFDRNVASLEALRLFDDFLDALVRRGLAVYVISGNHDSPERLAFGSRLLDKTGVHISRAFDGHIAPLTFADAYGEVNLYLLPFIKPVQVRRAFAEAAIETWTDAVGTVIADMQVDESARNVLLAHQFVTGAVTSDSEELQIGGAQNVDAAVFAPFDYVALGHLHAPQNVGSPYVRYCGTPLKYSFSEARHNKSATIVELAQKGSVTVREIPLVPKRELRELRGNFQELTAQEFYKTQNTGDYLRITLTDEDDQPDALRKLRVIYPNLMRLDYDNARTRANSFVAGAIDAQRHTPLQLFSMLYAQQNGAGFSDAQQSYLQTLIDEIWGAAQ